MSMNKSMSEWNFPCKASGRSERRVCVCVFPQVNDAESTVSVEFTPTIPHCSMATLIGLSIKVKLIRSLPERFKVSHQITGESKTGGLCSEKKFKKGKKKSAN